MKLIKENLRLLSLCLFCLNAPHLYSVTEIVQIELRERPSFRERELENRVWDLERAVRQLQDEVFHLRRDQEKDKLAKASETKYSCYIDIPLKGVFKGEGKSLHTAEAETLKACKDGGGSIFCKKDEFKCGQ